MMNQQINLHQPIFRKQRALFSAQIVLRICAIWAVALVLVYMLSLYDERTLRREYNTLVRSRDAAQERLQQLVSMQSETGHSQQLEIELQALWSHAIGPWFDLQTGARIDVGPGEERAHLVLGVQGLAPYWIEIDAAAFLSDQGDVTARIEAEHDVRITQSLILQPRAELDFALQDIPAERIGSGLVSVALGARLRYQVTPLFAPYVGVEYETSAGDTRDFRRAAGEDGGGWRALVGVRTWF